MRRINSHCIILRKCKKKFTYYSTYNRTKWKLCSKTLRLLVCNISYKYGRWICEP